MPRRSIPTARQGAAAILRHDIPPDDDPDVIRDRRHARELTGCRPRDGGEPAQARGRRGSQDRSAGAVSDAVSGPVLDPASGGVSV